MWKETVCEESYKCVFVCVSGRMKTFTLDLLIGCLIRHREKYFPIHHFQIVGRGLLRDGFMSMSNQHPSYKVNWTFLLVFNICPEFVRLLHFIILSCPQSPRKSTPLHCYKSSPQLQRDLCQTRPEVFTAHSFYLCKEIWVFKPADLINFIKYITNWYHSVLFKNYRKREWM